MIFIVIIVMLVYLRERVGVDELNISSLRIFTRCLLFLGQHINWVFFQLFFFLNVTWHPKRRWNGIKCHCPRQKNCLSKSNFINVKFIVVLFHFIQINFVEKAFQFIRKVGLRVDLNKHLLYSRTESIPTISVRQGIRYVKAIPPLGSIVQIKPNELR